MTFMFVVYKAPVDRIREATVTAEASRFGGQLDYREEPPSPGEGAVCLTYEFVDRGKAEAAAQALRKLGEHVEGPVNYNH
jgi:hypothetical protein